MVGLEKMTTISSRPVVTAAIIPSAHQLGDVVSFNPVALANCSPWTVKARVERISFDAGKVLYDLALEDDTGFYDVYPICNVDSIFVK